MQSQAGTPGTLSVPFSVAAAGLKPPRSKAKPLPREGNAAQPSSKQFLMFFSWNLCNYTWDNDNSLFTLKSV